MNDMQVERGRYLTRAECQQIVQRVFALAPTGYTEVHISSWLNGELRWARNRVSLSGDRCDVEISIGRSSDVGRGGGGCSTNQLDDISIASAVRYAERMRDKKPENNVWEDRFAGALKPPPLVTPATAIWSDATYAVTADDRGRITRMLADEAEAKGMLSAGYLETRSGSIASISNHVMKKGAPMPDMSYQQLTQAQCSMTVRHPRGMGSGWAGASSFDVTRVDGPALARRALDKCMASLNPVRIEPGRYTVVLEPQAVCGLVESVMGGGHNSGPLSRDENEDPDGAGTPFYLSWDEALHISRTKLGLKIMDERITISHDPADSILGVMPEPGLQPITWIQNGILTTLHHHHNYAREKLQRLVGQLWRPAFRVSGGDTTVSDMIATTKRGLLVTRFSGIELLDKQSLLFTGTTRDGLWLIENGAVTKAVWNLRFTESPLFALNQVDQLGVPQPVFRPGKGPPGIGLSPCVVPAMKIHDFSFTSLIDAI